MNHSLCLLALGYVQNATTLIIRYGQLVPKGTRLDGKLFCALLRNPLPYEIMRD